MQEGGELLSLLAEARKVGASDLLLVAGAQPSIYVNTQMQALAEERLGASEINGIVTAFLSAEQLQRLDQWRDLDFSFGHAEVGRCRINIHYQRRSLAVAVRLLKHHIPDLEQLGLPPKLAELTALPRGLVLVTGPTGSGKSTTLAAMVEHINRHRRAHVITLEDPIEFAFTHDQSIIEQREMTDDSPSFAQALRHVVRQKPDVIMVGELRDLETIAAALTAAETGHLVLASLHTNGAAQTIARIVDAFDSSQQGQIRVQLASSLKAISSQALFSNTRDGGMVPAVELMIMTPAMGRVIRDSDTHLIDGMIETGKKQGMQILDAAIAGLVSDGLISEDAAMAKAAMPERLERFLGRSATLASPIPVGSHDRRVGQATGPEVAGIRRPWE